MALDSTTLTNVQRAAYLNPLQRLVYTKLWFEKYMIDAKTKLGYKGENAFWIKLKRSLPETVAANLDYTGTFSNVSSSNYNKAYDYLRNYQIILQMTQGAKVLQGGSLENSGGIDIIKEQTMDAAKTAMLDLEWAFWNGGSTAALANVLTVNDGADTMTVDNVRGIRPGMVLDAFTANGATKTGDALTVASVGTDGTTIGFNSGSDLASISATHILYKDNLQTAGSIASVLPNGLFDLVKDSGTLHNINLSLAANSDFRAYEIDGSSPGTPEDISYARLNSMLSPVMFVRGKDIPPIAVCHEDVFEAIANLLRADRTQEVVIPYKDGVPAHVEYNYMGNTVKILPVGQFKKNTIIAWDPAKFVLYHNDNPDGTFLKFGQANSSGGYTWVPTGGFAEQAYFNINRQYANPDPQCTSRLNDVNGFSEES